MAGTNEDFDVGKADQGSMQGEEKKIIELAEKDVKSGETKKKTSVWGKVLIGILSFIMVVVPISAAFGLCLAVKRGYNFSNDPTFGWAVAIVAVLVLAAVCYFYILFTRRRK